MKQAYRVYSKGQKISHLSPAFKSNVHRQKNISLKMAPGPGQYDVTLPLVKPRYEAIYKNNRSIIIKVNDSPTAAFISKEPRFREFGTIDSQSSLADLQVRDNNESEKFQKNSKRYNFSLSKKSVFQPLSANLGSELKNPQKRQDRNSKGSRWSKYTVKRNLWSQSVNEKQPGPGSYYSDKKQKQNLYAAHETTSWQFKSITKRSSLQQLQMLENKKLADEGQQFIAIHSRANI